MDVITGGGTEMSVGLMVMGFTGGLALFLHGMESVTAGLKGMAGGSLSRFLSRVSGNRFTGVATGMLVTATIQSSTVTMVLVIGFLSAGLLTLVQSIGVIIGANIGTTITAQIIAFDIVRYALGMIAVGVLAQYLGRREQIRQVGTAIAGLGILFLGMGVMQGSMSPLREYEPFLDLMAAERGPVPGLLIGAGFTALVQSSSATIGIVIVMASQGLVPLETGIALALGASLGTAVTTMLATIGRPAVALRAGLVHVIFNVIGVSVMLVLIPILADLATLISPTAQNLSGQDRLAAETPRQIANAYTLAKTGMLLGFIGFTRQLAALVERLVPPRPSEVGLEPKYLDEAVLEAPAVAIGLARKELLRLGHRVLAQVERSMPLILTGSSTELTDLAEADDDIDDLHAAILAYLRRIDDDPLSETQGRELAKLMEIASYLEILGDVVQNDLVRVGLHRIEEGVPISAETLEVVGAFHAEMVDLLRTSLEAFDQQDRELAQSVLDAKPEVNDLLRRAAELRASRLTADAPARIAAYSRGTEAIEHLRRIYTFAKRIARSVPGAE
ncbi:MAG: Na/Pi cotransporter family protein [Intrasporangiaceae bacterium]|nr:Na/Pi cotransporter family protein [Intrasporangiaceae bacterium]